MTKETTAQMHWAKCQLAESDHPFAEETLEAVGEVDGVIRRLRSGRLVVTAEAMEDLLRAIQTCRNVSRRCLKSHSSGANNVKPNNSDDEHGDTE